MKTQIKKLKLELKSIAKQIRNQKKLRKVSHPHHDKYIGQWDTMMLSVEYRHKHVAYCLARGKTLEQCDSGEKLNMGYVDWIIKSMSPESREKLYVVVNEKLHPSQQAVQAGHAVASFLKKYPNTQWDNGYLIYLRDKTDYYGNMTVFGTVRNYAHEFADFKEPDLENKVTAYAVFGPEAESFFKNKALL